MCINIYENYSDDEKIELLQKYVDHVVNKYETDEYNLFCDIDNNNILKRKFLKAVVPIGFDAVSYDKLLKNDNDLLTELHKFIDNVGYEYPTFVAMCFVCGAIYCYDDEFISLKKLIGRGSKILLNY